VAAIAYVNLLPLAKRGWGQVRLPFWAKTGLAGLLIGVVSLCTEPGSGWHSARDGDGGFQRASCGHRRCNGYLPRQSAWHDATPAN
jgi:hypothetical protein